MNWRITQLGETLCDQDLIILDLYKNIPVKFIGSTDGFEKNLVLDQHSNHAVAILNQRIWLADLIDFTTQLNNFDSFYLGINRYLILGNNTNISFDHSKPAGLNIIELIYKILPDFDILKSGFFDDDQGKYFNFVQPLTWIYARNKNYRQ